MVRLLISPVNTYALLDPPLSVQGSKSQEAEMERKRILQDMLRGKVHTLMLLFLLLLLWLLHRGICAKSALSKSERCGTAPTFTHTHT